MSPDEIEMEREHISCHKRVDASLQVLQSQVGAMQSSLSEKTLRLETKLEKISHLLTEGSHSISSRLAVYESFQNQSSEQFDRLFEKYRASVETAHKQEVQLGIQESRLKKMEQEGDRQSALANQLKVSLTMNFITFVLSLVAMYLGRS